MVEEHEAGSPGHPQVSFEENDLVRVLSEHAVPSNGDGPVLFLVDAPVGCNGLLTGLLNARIPLSNIILIPRLVEVHAVLVKFLRNFLRLYINCEASRGAVGRIAFALSPQQAGQNLVAAVGAPESQYIEGVSPHLFIGFDKVEQNGLLILVLIPKNGLYLLLSLLAANLKVLQDLVPETEVTVIDLDYSFFLLGTVATELHFIFAIPMGQLFRNADAIIIQMPSPELLGENSVSDCVSNGSRVRTQHKEIVDVHRLGKVELPEEGARQRLRPDKEDFAWRIFHPTIIISEDPVLQLIEEFDC